jgi:hypothetical protein
MNQGAVFTGATAVDFAGHQFLARSGFTENEHRRFRRSDNFNLARDPPQSGAMADQVTKGLGVSHPLRRVNILGCGPIFELRLNSSEQLAGRFAEFAFQPVRFCEPGQLPADRLVAAPQPG